MKAINRFENGSSIEFDLTAPIIPLVGLGGCFFAQTIKDFRRALTNKSFGDESGNFYYSLDEKYFFLTIGAKNKEIEIEIDLFTGKINSMICRKGYLGKLENEFGIGTSIKTILARDGNLSFNLDTDWFDRAPFDGLIIYVPPIFKDKCVDAAVMGTDYPDFDIEVIGLIDLDFAKEHFQDGQLTFQV